ncbi:MAG: hypothetical protein E6Q97_25595 [Desulfurellales bacterium]|nr:MAG: hypothetical protein E6Q97_25595 [Desulfurellales bacterium]
MQSIYYIPRTVSEEDSERGPFAIICSHSVDGNVADVYGETEEDAAATAEEMLSKIDAFDWLEEQFRLSLGTGPAHAVACDVHRGMKLIDAIRKNNK